MEYECVNCKEKWDVGEILPKRSCDDTVFQCDECGQEVKLGWVGEVEVRYTFDQSDYDGGGV